MKTLTRIFSLCSGIFHLCPSVACPGLPGFICGCIMSLVFVSFLSAQPAIVTEDVWQEPWEGVPEYYSQWNYPDFQIPTSLDAWEKKRQEVRAILETLLAAPARPKPLSVRTVWKKQMTGYTWEKFVFDNGLDEKNVPGYLAIPDNIKGKAPTIIGLHGHGSSKDNIFGTNPNNTSQDIMALLVSQGYIVMAIDSYFNGERKGTGPAGRNEMQERGSDQEMSQFKLNLWFGRSLWGLQLRDEQIALDYLLSRPEVDPEKIGVTGMSMGSTRAWWLAAIDDRVKAVVGVACFTRYKELIEQRYLRAHGIYYFVPGMLKHFDTEAVMALIAPRPFLVLTGDSDAGSPLSGMKVLEEKLGQVYSLYGKSKNFRSVIYEKTGHIYTDEMKMEMVRWFGR